MKVMLAEKPSVAEAIVNAIIGTYQRKTGTMKERGTRFVGHTGIYIR